MSESQVSLSENSSLPGKMKGHNQRVGYKPARDWRGRFLPGHGGDYGGISLVGMLKEHLFEHPEEAESVVKALIAMGKEKELGAIKEMLDRIDGKVAERHQVEGELPIKLVFMPARQD